MTYDPFLWRLFAILLLAAVAIVALFVTLTKPRDKPLRRPTNVSPYVRPHKRNMGDGSR